MQLAWGTDGIEKRKKNRGTSVENTHYVPLQVTVVVHIEQVGSVQL